MSGIGYSGTTDFGRTGHVPFTAPQGGAVHGPGHPLRWTAHTAQQDFHGNLPTFRDLLEDPMQSAPITLSIRDKTLNSAWLQSALAVLFCC